MSAEQKLRILIATPLDYLKLNSTEQYRVEQYVRRGHDVTVLYNVMNQSKRPPDLLRDTLTCTFRVQDLETPGGTARLVGVDPFVNYFAGLRKNADEGQTGAPRRFSPRLLLIRLLSPIAMLRDVLVPPCFLLGYFLRVRGRFDVCLGTGPWGGLLGWMLKKLARVSLFVYEDRDYEPGLYPDRLRQSYTAALERFGIRRCDLLISVGRLLAELCRTQTGWEATVIPNGVNRADYAEARVERAPGSVLMYVGNVISWSGVEQCLRAMPRLAESCPDVRLKIVGGGLPAYLDRLKALADELGVTDRVNFLGPRDPSELPALLAGADLGIANSEPVSFRRFACPLKVMEYMAAGVPVLTTIGTEAAEFLLSCQTELGDIRGFIGNQYATYYTGAILGLTIRAGYARDARIERGMQWLLSMRQEDGGWTIPILTHELSRDEGYRLTSEYAEPLEPDRTKPFSHNWTGMVLRAFAAHPYQRRSRAARRAGELYQSRFFQPDVYGSYKSAGHWVRFQFPFWWNHLVAGLDSLAGLGFTPDDPPVERALSWLLKHQQRDGLWRSTYEVGRQAGTNSITPDRLWIGLAICRVLRRYWPDALARRK